MDFDIVIVTRNRHKVLPISIPLMLSQSRLPQKFIVIDSSDNHHEVRQIVESVFSISMADVRLEIHKTSPGTSYQRNMGLQYVESPVVFFPDDDALWFPDVAENMMRIYERDREGLAGAVCAAESIVPPSGVFDNAAPLYHMAFRDRRLWLTIGALLDRIENLFFENPLYIEGYSRWREKKVPEWLEQEDAILCGPMTGFRMSFRADLIRKIGFDEELGRYSFQEDVDASLAILKNHLIVCAKKANVFHYRSPEQRADGLEWGLINILNRAYVLCKHSPPGSLARRRLKRYSCFKLARSFSHINSANGRQMILGICRALSRLSAILEASEEELSARYLQVRRRCLKNPGSDELLV